MSANTTPPDAPCWARRAVRAFVLSRDYEEQVSLYVTLLKSGVPDYGRVSLLRWADGQGGADEG
jgi:hypothetical protein